MQTDPLTFINSSRFDILAKYIYAYFLHNNIDSDFGFNLYKDHLKVWNNYQTGDGKNGLQEYVDTFTTLLHSIKTEGFNPEKSVVPTTQDFRLINGSHRVAACLLYKKDISYKIGGKGQTDVNYQYFINRKKYVPTGLSVEYCDAIAVQYCKLKPNTYVATIFPSANGPLEEAENILNNETDLFYKKTIQLHNQGPLNLIRELYYNENWTHRKGTLERKVSYCFKTNKPIIVYVVTSKDNIKHIKQKIRNILKAGRHSIHINDTKEETIRISRCLFNNNSINYMNTSRPGRFNKFEEYLKYFKEYIEHTSLDSDNYCITASSTLSRYGLREGHDLDYLHKGQQISGHNMIHSHNSYAPGRYHTSIDNIIYNPVNYFYFNNIKFASIDTVRKLKELRSEPKDLVDINLINNI